VAGRYVVWTVTLAVGVAGLGVGGTTAAAASTIDSSPTSVAVGALDDSFDAAALIHAESHTPGTVPVERERSAVTETPVETPTAEVPTAGTETTQGSPLIMMGGLAMLAFAILLVVRSGSTRKTAEDQ
jgi:hypothetical protein